MLVAYCLPLSVSQTKRLVVFVAGVSGVAGVSFVACGGSGVALAVEMREINARDAIKILNIMCLEEDSLGSDSR